MGPRDGKDAMVNRKILKPCRESNPGRPTRSLVPILTGLDAVARRKIPAPAENLIPVVQPYPGHYTD